MGYALSQLHIPVCYWEIEALVRFHSTDDRRMPAKFICFDCRLKADVVSWTMIKEGLYPRIMEKYRDFVTFRYVFLCACLRVVFDGTPSAV